MILDSFAPGVIALDGSILRSPPSAPAPACWDLREIRRFFGGAWCPTVDLQWIVPGQGNRGLVESVRAVLGVDEELERLHGLVQANLRAAAQAGVDVARHGPVPLVPRGIMDAYLEARRGALEGLLATLDPWAVEDLRQRIFPVAMALFEVEDAGIRCDVGLAKRLSTDESLPVHSRRACASMTSAPAGFLRSKFSPVGVTTGRLRTTGGFPCMTIPRGAARAPIVSRFVEGSIVTFDLNAIDYRCIVASVCDMRLRTMYADADDFHARTAAELFGPGRVDQLRRGIVKNATYTHVYGGKDETLARQTGLSLEKVRKLVARMDSFMGPIARFRDELADDARASRRVLLPDGSTIPVSSGDHPGKIIGLFAQGYSSIVFNRMIVRVVSLLRKMDSRLIFTVHDELVVDLHPDDERLVEEIRRTMESAGDGKIALKVKVKRGNNYDDATR